MLQTDKLLPFLQTQFSQQEASQPYKSQGFESDHQKDAPGGAAASASNGVSDSFHSDASESGPLLGAEARRENGSTPPTPVPRKHARKAIKGEWQFKMYTDVLHAQVVLHNKLQCPRPGGNPGANGLFLESTPIQMPPSRGGIYGGLTSYLPSTRLQGGTPTSSMPRSNTLITGVPRS